MTSTRMSAGNGFAKAQVYQLMDYARQNRQYDMTFEQAEAILADHNGEDRLARDQVYVKGKELRLADLTEQYAGLKSIVYVAPHVGTGEPAFHQVFACTWDPVTLQYAVEQAGDGFVTFHQWNEDGEAIEHRVRATSVWQIVKFDVEAHHSQI